MNKLAVFALTAMVAMNAGAPAFAKEVCHEVTIRTTTCEGATSTSTQKNCKPGTQTATVCRQVPDTATGGKAASGGIVQGGFSSSPSGKNAMTGAKKMSRMN